MTFDKWFYKQSKILQVILLIIPFVGWIVEILVRLSVMLRTKSLLHIVVFILYVIFGAPMILEIIDIIWLVLTGHLILAK